MAAERSSTSGAADCRATARPPGTTWRATLRRAARGFRDDGLIDRAAALTYYAVLSAFPGLIVLVSLLGLLGVAAGDRVQAVLTLLAPNQAGEIIIGAIDEVQRDRASAGVAVVLGLLGALWATSAYVAAFMRAANAIYDVPEGRPIWKIVPVRIGLTVALGLMLMIGVLIVVSTGELTVRAGALLGIREPAAAAWNVAKWPVSLVLFSLIFEVLYWAAPNVRRRFRPVSPGGLVAVVIWLLASVGFAIYVANFGSYNRTYGSLAAAVIFLVWLWLTNLAILFGAELDAELARGRAIAAGHPPEQEPYLELRDARRVGMRDGSVPG